MWRVRVTTLAVQNQYVLHILSVYLYPWLSNKRCTCAVLYCPTVFFQNCLINGTIFGKTLFNITCLFWTSPECLYKIFYILIRIQRNIITMYAGLQVIAPSSRPVLTKLQVSSQIFEKMLNQILWKSFQLESSCSIRTDGRVGGQTDKHDETPVAFSNFSKAYKNLCQKCYACKHLQFRSTQNVFEPPSPNNVSRTVTGARILRSCVMYRVMLASWFFH